MKKIISLIFVSVLFINGCAFNISTLKPDIPRLHVIDKVPVKVAIFIPESTRNMRTVEEIPSGCFGTQVNFATPFGEAFEKTVEGVFSQVFDEVTVIGRLPAPEGFDAIFEASLNKVSYKICCLASPGCYSDAGGRFRIIDNNGKELWNSRTRSARGNEMPMLGGMGMAQASEQLGSLFSSALTKLATEWSLDAKDSPQLKQYVYRASAPPSTPAYTRSEIKQASTHQPSDVDIDIPSTGVKNPNAIAVIIANSDYKDKDIPSVDFALNDAETVKKYLINVLGYREGNIIFEPNATKAAFEMTFGTERNYKGKLYNYLKKGKSDIFIYYSGHGAPDTNTNSGYFVPSDANAQAIGLTGYPLEQLYSNVAKISKEMKTPNTFVVIDSCFSGASEKGLILKNVSPITIKVKTPLVNLKNAVVMTSSSGAEVSSWYPEKAHSMFTYFFLQGLKDMAQKGKKVISASDIYNFITDETEGLPYYARRLHGRTQTPQIMGDIDRVMVGR